MAIELLEDTSVQSAHAFLYLARQSIDAIREYYIDCLGYSREEVWQLSEGFKGRDAKLRLIYDMDEDQLIEAAEFLAEAK